MDGGGVEVGSDCVVWGEVWGGGEGGGGVMWACVLAGIASEDIAGVFCGDLWWDGMF